MTDRWEIPVVALVIQLAVPSDEEVRSIIAGLPTCFDLKVVVAAAGSTFATWTTLEILLGQVPKNTLSPAVLDAITAVLFVTFAVLPYRSTPDTPAENETATTDEEASGFDDVSTVLGYEPSTQGLDGLLPIFAITAAGGFGDETQLVTTGLTVQHSATLTIWAGEMLVVILVSIANAYFLHRFSCRFDTRKTCLDAAGLLAFFVADTLPPLATGFSVWETLVGTASDAVLTLF